jgi:cell division septation protein DedD
LNKHPTALNFESVDAAKPIASYIAAGLGASGLLLALIIGWQNSNANSRIEELQQAVSKLQQQNSTPADNSAQANPATNPAAATDQQTIQKQLDELKAADATMAGQIADLHKVLQKNVATAKADALLSKKMASLSSQNSQVDAKLEDLQNKISSLKKTPSPAAVSAVVPPPPPPPAAAPKAEVNKAKAEDGWAVNLIAFKQDWFAKRKAEEFASKGITAKVSKADAKGQTWYRLSVDGFKSQAEAASFAEKAKKSLNLDSVLIVHSQN